ncbi:MAG TPA: ComEC/Rec2 family competence protein, partial [Bryobacteraceae bacterium]|nr:ComEC/Rec2 family competence protein [Bryobacteraceae bacterium]
SAAGFSLFLLARWFFRRGRVLNLLGAVVLAILALDPQAVFDPSFQLTVLSVAAIGGLAVPLNERFIEPYRQALRRLGNPDLDAKQPPAMAELRIEVRLISETAALLTRSRQSWWSACFQAGGTVWLWAVETVLISACIQAALAVPMIFYFHRISVTSVLANLTVSPALSVAVPAAFLACLTGIGPVVQITRLLLWWSGAAVEFWASLESAWRTPDPPVALAVFCLVSLTILGCCLCVRTRPGITWFAAAAALTGVAAVSTLHVAPILHPGELELSIIDVGQGDSLLVVAPDGKTLLVDGGGAPSFDPRFKPALDIGEDVVSPYLWRRGISRLDVIAVTHLHADHAAGLPALIRNFRPAELWTGGLAPGSLTEDVLRAARSSGTRVVQLNESVAVRLGSARVTVLAPAGEYRPGASASNSDSLVLRIAHGSRSFLLTGDADHRVETALMAHPETLEADVLKVAHHGSRSSSQTDFLAAVRPLFAAISAGADNSYGHPHPELVERLNAAGCRSWQTDRSGLVSFYTNGRRIRMENSFQPDEQP